jgi:1,4-dihydroxy-6-naphthoate synthase
MSIHQYAHVADRYALTSCGASMGDGYGPMIVARDPINLRQLITPVTEPDPKLEAAPPAHALRLAIPGRRTSAWLACQLMLLENVGVQPGSLRAVNCHVVPFDQIMAKVAAGEFDAGLIIHEGQLTYANAGLRCIVDLGQWWKDTRQLPLPLGGNAIRRDLADEAPAICRILLESIRYALDHRQEAVAYALNYARDMNAELADRFVGMYVNDYTLDFGESGRRAVARLMREAADAGLIPDPGRVDFVHPRK